MKLTKVVGIVVVAAGSLIAGCDSPARSRLTTDDGSRICRKLQDGGLLRAGLPALDACLDAMNDVIPVRD